MERCEWIVKDVFKRISTAEKFSEYVERRSETIIVRRKIRSFEPVA